MTELTPLQRAFSALEATRRQLAAVEERAREPIAVVGLACRFPGEASDARGFWSLLREERSAVVSVPTTRWDHAPFFDPSSVREGTTYAQHAGFIHAPVEDFDAAFFGISPREAAAMDPQQRLLLEVAWEAFEEAGIAPDRLQGSATGVFVGMPSGDYAQLQLRGGTLHDIDAHYASGIAHSIAAGRLSYLLGLQGPSLAIDTACSSSLVAVHLACQSLRTRDSDLAVAAGVNLILSPESFIAFSRTHMLASDGRCKAFDDAADGFVRGEGCGVVILKRLSDARNDGDRIMAVIRGSAANQDGASASLTAPSGPAQEAVIRRALEQASLAPSDVQFVEAHGTGTSLGDPIELRALGAVYGAARAAGDALIVGSVKANVGHLEGAAGVASLIKTILALQSRHVPGQLNVARPTSHVDWSALRVRLPLSGGEEWPTAARRRAGVSAFGFSGTNAHLIVEEAPDTQRVPAGSDRRPLQIVPIAGRTPGAVRALADAYASQLTDDDDLAAVAHTAGAGRAQFAGARRAVAVRDVPSARASLLAVAADPHIIARPPGHAARAAFLFTGQGSQTPGMARELYDIHPTFRASIDSSAECLKDEWNGLTLHEVLFGEQAGQRMQDARYVQPALVAVELALAALWQSWGVEPLLVAGHSLGEYAAAAFAGVMTPEDALRLVAARGRLMSALPPVVSAMTSASAPLGVVRAAVGGLSVEFAADNGASCVLTGTDADVSAAEAVLRDQHGVTCRRLSQTTNAFHSRHIEPMLDAFETAASAIPFRAPRIPVCWNLGTDRLGMSAAPDATYWRQQTRETVHFGEVMDALRARRVTHAIEIGPHPVLTGLVAAVDDPVLPSGVASLRRGRSDWETLAGAVCQWWQDGGRIDWAAFDAPFQPRITVLPTYPFERTSHWLAHARVGAAPAPRAAGHALVGARVTSPALESVVFEREVSVATLSLLSSHRIFGRATMPGAAWIEAIAVAAMRAYPGERLDVADLMLHAPLQQDDQDRRVVQLVVRAAEETGRRVSVYSRSASDDTTWTLHADARLVPAEALPSVPTAAPIVADTALPDALYRRFASVGLTLGTEFRLVTGAEQRGERATATLDLSPVPSWSDGLVHPVVIDACIQAIALAVPADREGEEQLYMPFAVERFSWHGAVPTQVRCEAVVRGRPTHGETMTADVVACDADGRVVGQLRGVTLKRATASALRRASLTQDDTLFEVQWEPRSLPSRPSADETPAVAVPLETIRARVIAQGPIHATREALDRYRVDGPAMDRLSAQYIWRALERLGMTWQRETRFDVADLASRLGVPSKLLQQFARFVEILVEDGALRREDGQYVVASLLDTSTIDESVRRLRESGSPFAGELALLVRCGEHLAPALSGAIDPLTLLFPDGSLDDVHRIYRDSPFPRTYNALVRDAVTALRSARGGAGPLRILEVGGGTGGTTAAVLEAIPDGDAAYVFTDASPLFLSRARERFAHRRDVTYRVFDLEHDPVAQGFDGASFDLVVAANVIHATRDVAATLRRLNQLLAPGGAVLMLEMSRPSRWVDLSFGFTDGWWAFADDFRTTYPLLSPADWQRVLAHAGFSEVSVALGEPGSGDGLEEQALVVARTSAGADRAGWVLLADTRGFAHALAPRLAARGDRVTVLDVPAVGGPSAESGAERQWLTAALAQHAAGGGVRGVVDLRALAADEVQNPLVPQGAARAATAAITAAQATVMLDHGAPAVKPRLWYLTTRAVRTDAADAAPSLPPSTVWGVARSVQLEHPELRATCLDLPDADADAALLDAVVDELTLDSPELQVAVRGTTRLVARVDRAAQAKPNIPPVYTVAPRTRGILESLEVGAAVLPTPAPHEIVVRVASSGLNFKDVLNALGAYPGDAGPLGGECAGTVVAVGAAVTRHHVGDRVVAVGSAAMGSHVATHEALAAMVPSSMALDVAAALPIAYLTAWHTLVDVAKLQRGERVLIHAGAGGVGMAAIHLARRIGAEVFATAGSEAKRALLRDLGVSHVFDSRTTAFADEILTRTEGLGVHVTLNSLADDFVERSLAATMPGGRFVEIGKRGIWTPAQVERLGKALQYHVVDWTGAARANPVGVGATLETLLQDIARGDLPTLPVQVFPLARVQDAFRFMAAGRHVGKLVVSHREALDAAGWHAVHIVPDAAYVIVGGTAGLGLLTAQWLADRGATHLVLCSRSGGDAHTDAAVAPLVARGVRVDRHAIDVSDARAVARMLDATRAVSPIRGIVQSAGQLDDGAVLQLDRARVERVFGPKVTGTWNLHTLTQSDPLDFFVAYASVAGFLGSAGQANHAAANAFIDALAHHRRACGAVAVSIDWGAWDEVGAAVRHGVLGRAAGAGVRSIAPSEGLAMLSRVLEGSAAQVAAVSIDWHALVTTRPAAASTFLERMVVRATPSAPAPSRGAGAVEAPPATSLVAELSQMLAARRPAAMRTYLRERVARTLGLPVGQLVDDRQPLRDAGLDSLLAIELRNSVGAAVERSLPATLLFDYPTIDDLATYLLMLLYPESPSPGPAAPEAPVPETAASLLSDLSALSDEEVDRMLAAKRRSPA